MSQYARRRENIGKSHANLQDMFLNQMRRDKVPCDVHLTNGSTVSGIIRGFDNFAVLVRYSEGTGQEMIYKHSIASIAPLIDVDPIPDPEPRAVQQTYGASGSGQRYNPLDEL
jgi:host factor-I protein